MTARSKLSKKVDRLIRKFDVTDNRGRPELTALYVVHNIANKPSNKGVVHELKDLLRLTCLYLTDADYIHRDSSEWLKATSIKSASIHLVVLSELLKQR